MGLISRKKRVFPVARELRSYLQRHGRVATLPVHFASFNRYSDAVSLYDRAGRDTLWKTLIFPPDERAELGEALVRVYATLKVHGRVSLMEHLVTDRIDVCTWGNTLPARIRILNRINENFDYFYIKRADASRVYGLELEHLLSPNRIEFLVDGETVVEEHIAGIPGDAFLATWIDAEHVNEIRLAKEFVKFNERAFVRLLGDMHAGNWVVDITPDFDETHYRIRAIDFDQQSYEGRSRVYRPQYFKENNRIVFVGMKMMTARTYEQYQQEELTLIASRAKAEDARLQELLTVMAREVLAPAEHVAQLARELGAYYRSDAFARCRTMGDVVAASLDMLPDG
ncbi:MAG: hypothetical protein AAF928_09030 [Myxococcota bacterium]